MVEPTGAETELVLRVGEITLVVVHHGRTTLQPDDVIGLQIDASKVHLFDTVDGRRLP